MLIVCEGSRTEPLYFRDIADHYQLSTANVVVVGSGSDPATLVRKAKELRGKESRLGERYDRVYCVFDRDEHRTFAQACEEARASAIEVVRSWPCFEFWLRLHFGFSRKPYARSGGRSAAQRCADEIGHWLPGYAKGMRGVFGKLEDRLESAKVDAARALADAEATGEPNPSTEAHMLVSYLQTLKLEPDG